MLVSQFTQGLGHCRAPFDPGAVIDDEGTGWLSFGGGGKREVGTDYMPALSAWAKTMICKVRQKKDGLEIESIFFLYISNKIITYSGYPLYPMRSTVLHLLGSLLLSL